MAIAPPTRMAEMIVHSHVCRTKKKHGRKADPHAYVNELSEGKRPDDLILGLNELRDLELHELIITWAAVGAER